MQIGENGFVLVVAALLLLVLGLLSTLVFLVLKLLKNNPDIITNSPKTLKTNKPSSHHQNEGMCHYHSNEAARAQCAICSDLLCQQCNREYEHLHFCPTHFELYTSHQWRPLTTVVTRPQTPQHGVALYEFKENLWDNKKIPSYVVTHYKIDVETDQIESYIQLYVREEEFTLLSSLYDVQKEKGSISQ
jgi:hypothetical protein